MVSITCTLSRGMVVLKYLYLNFRALLPLSCEFQTRFEIKTNVSGVWSGRREDEEKRCDCHTLTLWEG